MPSLSAVSVTVAEPLSVSIEPPAPKTMLRPASSVTVPPPLRIGALTTTSSEATSRIGPPALSIASSTISGLAAARSIVEAALTPSSALTPPIVSEPVLRSQMPPSATAASSPQICVSIGFAALPTPVAATSTASTASMSLAASSSMSTIAPAALIETVPAVDVTSARFASSRACRWMSSTAVAVSSNR